MLLLLLLLPELQLLFTLLPRPAGAPLVLGHRGRPSERRPGRPLA